LVTRIPRWHARCIANERADLGARTESPGGQRLRERELFSQWAFLAAEQTHDHLIS